MKTMAFNEALREGLHEEMARDDSIFVIGEDVIAHGGPYKVTEGVAERFPGRIFETPIAEAGIVGVGVGAALAGMRPVVELMYLDFVTCAMDEVVNQAAKMRYMSGGQGSVPIVIRLSADCWPHSIRRLWSRGLCTCPDCRWWCRLHRLMRKACSKRPYVHRIR